VGLRQRRGHGDVAPADRRVRREGQRGRVRETDVVGDRRREPDVGGDRRIVDPSQAARGARLGERAVVGRTPSATRARIESSWSAIVDEGASTERSTVGVARNVRGGAQWRGCGRRRPEAADVGDPAAAAGLRAGAGATGERAATAIRDRAAVLALRRAGRRRACGRRRPEAADVGDPAAAAGLRGGAGATGERAAAAIRDRAAVLALRRAGRGRAPRTCGERSHEEDDERQGQEATWCHGRLRAKA